MKLRHLKTTLATFGAILLCATGLPRAFAQQIDRGTLAAYPILFSPKNGTEASRATAVHSVKEILQKAGYTLTSNEVAHNTWRRLKLPAPTMNTLSRRRDIVRFGKEMKVRYVVATTVYFHSRSIWVNLGPKTISTATVGITITDIGVGKVVYRKRGVEGRSDEKESTLKVIGDVLLTPLVTMVSGGPKTPHEQRAAQIAVARALRGWLKITG